MVDYFDFLKNGICFHSSLSDIDYCRYYRLVLAEIKRVGINACITAVIPPCPGRPCFLRERGGALCMCSVTHLKKRRCFLIFRSAGILLPLAACLTSATPSGSKPIINTARSSAASAEFRRNGIFRNTPFLKLGHRTHTQRSPSLTKETGPAGAGRHDGCDSGVYPHPP